MAAKELDLGLVVGPPGKQGGVGPAGPQGVQGVPGRDATVNGYNAVTLEATGNVTLTQVEGALTIKTSEALDATVKWHSNPNLLINCYFANPVNRNGQTEYTVAGYTIDRWRITIDGIRLSLNSEDGSMKLNNAGSSLNSGIVQQVSWEKQDKPVNVTFSVLYKGSIVATLWGIGRILVEKENDTLDMATFSYEIPASADLKNSLYCPYISAGIGKSVQIVAAKLELGDQQTLAHLEGDTWVLNEIPDYAEQYAICEQYSPITGEFVGSQHSNPPLLRNRYFVGGGSQRGGGQLPINQLGKTEYTGIGYSIDGWNIAELQEGASVKIENDGIIITASSDHFIHFNQQIEHYLTLKGSVVTASLLLADGSLLCTHFPLGEVGNGISLIPNEVYIFSIDALHFCIRVLPQKSIKLRAVNLELGDTQTFAHKEGDQWVLNDPPPNYQQELAKCQWHQVVYGGSVYAPIGRFICYTDGTVRIFVDLPTTIRIAPAVRIIGMLRLHPIDGVDMYLPADSAATYVDACNNMLVFDCPSPGAKQGQTGWADLAAADAKLIIDANL